MYKRREQGFTLIEVLAVVVVVGIIAAIALPRFLGVKSDAETKACAGNVASINVQLERLYTNTGLWPGDKGSAYATLAAFLADTNYFPDGAPTCPSGGTYTLSSTTHRVSCSATGH